MSSSMDWPAASANGERRSLAPWAPLVLLNDLQPMVAEIVPRRLHSRPSVVHRTVTDPARIVSAAWLRSLPLEMSHVWTVAGGSSVAASGCAGAA